MTIEQHNFITQYLRHSSEYTAYCLAFNPENAADYNAIMSAAASLMNDPEVGGVIRSVIDGIRQDVEQEIRAQQKTELLTVQSKRELLARIARGELTAVQHYKGKDCNHCTQMVLPTINQMLKAIDLDSKLAGHYSAEKRQATVDSLQLTKSENTSENATKCNNSPVHRWRGYPQTACPAIGRRDELLAKDRKHHGITTNTTNEQSLLPGEGWLRKR